MYVTDLFLYMTLAFSPSGYIPYDGVHSSSKVKGTKTLVARRLQTVQEQIMQGVPYTLAKLATYLSFTLTSLWIE